MANKVLYIDSAFTKEVPASDNEPIMIAGYASTVDVDRAGDVVPPSVWAAGMKNYVKNPIVLFQHDHDDPIGQVIEHRVDERGLWVKARISAAAEVYKLIKDGVLKAFSIGFRVLDADYNAETNLFIVKELELLEISVVSIPCNQETLFSLSKSFESENDYKDFKSQFAIKSESAKGSDSSDKANSNSNKEWNMNPEEIQKMLAEAAEKATKAALEKAEADRLAREKAIAEKAAEEARINKAVEDAVKAATAKIEVGASGAEKLLAEVEKRFADQAEASKKALEGLEGALKEKAAELAALQNSRMQFSDRNQKDGSDYSERETAYLLSKITGKSIEGTKFGQNIVQKTGAHLPSATWELEVSLNMENEVRRRLVVAPVMRSIAMKTNVMTMPVNPEAGHANWVTNAQFGTSNSAGGTTAGTDTGSPHLLKEITLNAYKLATNEYLAYEEEEDSLLALMPIVRDAMVRRTARGVDKAFLLGAGAGADPVQGLAKYDTVSAVTKQVANAADSKVLRDLRKDLGAWGLDPAGVIYIVNTEFYYDLMEDSLFQTMDKVGDRATILTGQVGMVGGSPVLVSAELPAKASGANSGGNVANVGAIAFAPGNFLVGNQRGLRFDTQDLVETQRKVLVASLRTGMTQVTTNQGLGVSAFRWLV